MAPILFNQFRSVITSPLISIFCKKFEEKDMQLKKSIETSIGTVLIGIENILDNTLLYDKIIEYITITEFYKTIEYEKGTLSSINYSFEQEGNKPLNLIFSNKKDRISEMISNEVGVKSNTAESILNFAVMLILSHLKTEKIEPKNIQNTLDAEKNTILNSIPDGIRVILGYANHEPENRICSDIDPFSRSTIKFHILEKIKKIKF